MRHRKIALLFIFLSISMSIALAQDETVKSIFSEKLQKKAKAQLSDMAFIPMGSFNTSSYQYYKHTESDSLLIVDGESKTVSVQSFYMSKMEISNKQYKEFVQWTKELCAMNILAKYDDKLRGESGKYKEEIPIDWNHEVLKKYLFKKDGTLNTDSLKYSFEMVKIISRRYDEIKYEIDTLIVNVYPDTSVWNKNKLIYPEIYTEHYFNHPDFSEFPVVAVSYIQSLAYCYWRSQQLYQDIFMSKKSLDSKSHYFNLNSFLESDKGKAYKNYAFPEFRLPTEVEWQYAALGGHTFAPFPWGSEMVFSKDGKSMANFKTITDVNGIPVLSGNENNQFKDYTTTKGGSYPPNDFGLYDMGGNVSEWCSTKYSASISSYSYSYDLAPSYNEEDYTDLLRIVKGGSWADGLIYQLVAAKTYLKETESSSKIGFRIVMTYLGDYSIK